MTDELACEECMWKASSKGRLNQHRQSIHGPELPNYRTMHTLVEKLRGKASEYSCCRCYGQAEDWSTVHDPVGDGRDPWGDYWPLCTRCHLRYDGIAFSNPQDWNAPGQKQRLHDILKRRYAENPGLAQRIGAILNQKVSCPQCGQEMAHHRLSVHIRAKHKDG